MVPRARVSQQSEWQLNQFSHFCTAHGSYQHRYTDRRQTDRRQTDRQTNHAVCNIICRNRPHLAQVLVMQTKNNAHYNVYGAITNGTATIIKIRLVHLTNTISAPGGCQPSEQDNWLGLQPSTSTITIYYYYSTQQLIRILPVHKGWKAQST